MPDAVHVGDELDAAMGYPTAAVAVAMRSRAGDILGRPLTAALRDRLEQELAAATGSTEWAAEHLRDVRPLGEFLETQRLVNAQRRLFSRHRAA